METLLVSAVSNLMELVLCIPIFTINNLEEGLCNNMDELCNNMEELHNNMGKMLQFDTKYIYLKFEYLNLKLQMKALIPYFYYKYARR